MATELGVGYITLIPSAKGITASIEQQLGGPLVAAGRSSGLKTSSAFGSSFKAGIKTAAVGAGLVAGIAAIGGSFDKAFDKIALGSGATGKTLDGLQDSFKNVLKSGSNSMESVAAAVTTLYQRTGLTGKALEDFANKEATLARITDTDVNANLQATTGLFNLFGIAALQQSGKLDVLFKASQIAGVSITELASEMQSAAPTAKILGLSIDQTASLVANLDKAGLPASKVMLGLAGAFAKAAKAGKDPLDVIRDLTAQIKAAPTPTAAATIAVQKFGIGARQAATLVAGLRSGAIDLNESLEGGKGILDAAKGTDDFAEKLTNLKNVALVGLEPLASQVFGAITAAVVGLTPIVAALTDHMDVLGPIVLTAATAFVAFKVSLGITHFIQGISAGLVELRAAMFATAVATEGATAATSAFALTPIGAVAAAAAAAIAIFTVKTALFSHGQKDAGRATNDLIASLLDEGNTLDDVASKVLVKAIRGNKSLAETFKAMKVPLATVNDALLGNKKAVGEVVTAAAVSVRTGKISIDQYEALTGFIGKNARSLHDQKEAYDASSSAAKELASAEAAGTAPAKSAAVAQDQLRIAATNLTTTIINNADRLRGLQEGLVGVLQSAINLRQGLRDIADKQKALTDAQAKYGASSKEAAVAADDLALAQLGQIGNTDAAIDTALKQADAQSHLTDHLKTQAEATDALAKARSDLKTGKGSAEAVARAEDDLARATQSVADSQTIQTEVIKRLADRVTGPLHVALLEYLRDITIIPTKKETKVETPGLEPAARRFHDYRGEMDKLPGHKATKIDLDAGKALSALATLKAQINSLPSDVPFSAVVRAEGGRLAKGGPARPGRDYLVGERGTELLRMYGRGAYVFSHSHPKTQRALRVPELATGGTFKKPTLAVVGEDARTSPEIVSPVKLMAETFRSVLESTISTSVLRNETTSKTTITADAAQAVKTVKGYLVELAEMPTTVTTSIVAETGPAVSGFSDLVQAVSVSVDPFDRVSTKIRDIGRETVTTNHELRESTKTVREIVRSSSDLVALPKQPAVPAVPARTDSGKFAPGQRFTPSFPVVSPAAPLTPAFQADAQRERRSVTVTNNQENHFEGRPPIEELAALNQKLGMRVAIAGRR